MHSTMGTTHGFRSPCPLPMEKSDCQRVCVNFGNATITFPGPIQNTVCECDNFKEYISYYKTLEREYSFSVFEYKSEQAIEEMLNDVWLRYGSAWQKKVGSPESKYWQVADDNRVDFRYQYGTMLDRVTMIAQNNKVFLIAVKDKRLELNQKLADLFFESFQLNL